MIYYNETVSVPFSGFILQRKVNISILAGNDNITLSLIDNTYIILNSTGNVTINLTENYTWSGTHTFTGSGNIPVFEFGAEMKGTFQSAIGFAGHASLLSNGFGAPGIMGLLGRGTEGSCCRSDCDRHSVVLVGTPDNAHRLRDVWVQGHLDARIDDFGIR